MSNTRQAQDISEVIRARRTIKPDKMNGRVIPDEDVLELLNAADWAPTHAKTEPWRFVVINQSRAREFTNRHAELFKQQTDPATFTQQKFDNLARLGDNVSHIIVAWMKRVSTHKIPEVEEVAATAAAIQNILLTATAKGIATFWSTGGLTHHPAMRNELGLGEEDLVLGILYLGYTDEPFREGSRIIPLSEKVEWRK